MKEFAISETAMIRLKAMVPPILYAVVLKQLGDLIDPFPVVEFIFANLFTALCSVFSLVASMISTAQYCKCYPIRNFYN